VALKCAANVEKLFSLTSTNRLKVSKISAYTSGAPFRCSHQGLAPGLCANNLHIWKELPGTITLAYMAFSKMPQKKVL
jgi:hypothetical protein